MNGRQQLSVQGPTQKIVRSLSAYEIKHKLHDLKVKFAIWRQ